MNIEDLTLKQIKEISSLTGNEKNNSSPYKVGQKYFIRTVTMALVGKLVEVHDNELVLEKSSWIADTGRFHDFVAKGVISDNFECESFHKDKQVIVGRNAIIDATIWDFDLPEK